MDPMNNMLSQPAPEQAPTIRLSPSDADRLKREIEANGTSSEAAQRVYQRWPLDCRSVKMEVVHPGGASTTLHYVPRNLSREGIGLLHSAYIYPGTRCTVWLPHPSRGLISMPGAVVRCKHFRGKVHEVGVRFDQPIDVRDFLGLDDASECFVLENVKPESLCGAALLVAPAEMDRLLIRSQLRDTNLTVTSVQSAAEALARAGEGYDLILSDLALPDGDGVSLIDQLRSAGIRTPVLLMCPDLSPAKRERVRAAQPDGIIPKPVASQTLLAAIGEFVLVRSKDLGGGGAAIYSTLSRRDPLEPHVPAFVKELRQLGDKLSKAITASDTAECRRLALQIRGSAPTFGFAAIADAAATAHMVVQSSQNLSEAAGALKALIAACNRAQSKRHAA